MIRYKKLIHSTIGTLYKRKYLPMAVFVLVFAGFGLVVLVNVLAGANVAHFEAENSSTDGNASIISDTDASNSQALKFNEPAVTDDPVTYPEPWWHADADTDKILSDSTIYWKRNRAINGNPDRFTIVNDPLGLYGKVYRAQTTPQELADGDRRAEFSAAEHDSGEQLKLGVDDGPVGSTRNVYFGWRSLFGSGVLLNGASNNGNWMQIKGDVHCGGPTIGMTIKYNKLTMRSEQFLTEYKHIAWNGPEMSTLFGQWHDFVMHMELSKDGTVGYLELWFNGEKQTMMNGNDRIYFPTICPEDNFVFPKLGVYSFDAPAPGEGPVHWIESPRIGSSYESVVPR